MKSLQGWAATVEKSSKMVSKVSFLVVATTAGAMTTPTRMITTR